MVPGPTIYVPAGQDLTINLLNNLGESTSIVIQGQKLTGGLQRNADGRVTAFTSEADAGAGEHLSVDIRGRRAEAGVIHLPFYKRNSA